MRCDFFSSGRGERRQIRGKQQAIAWFCVYRQKSPLLDGADEGTSQRWQTKPERNAKGNDSRRASKKTRSKVGSIEQLADGRVRVRVAHGYDLNSNPRRDTGYADSMEDAERVALELAAELGRRPDLGRSHPEEVLGRLRCRQGRTPR